MEINEVESVVEALLFAAGDVLSLEKLSDIIEIDRKTLKNIIAKMADSYLQAGRGIIIREINGGYQLCTKPEYFDYLKKLIEPRQKQGLSQAAFETLAIIAYKQPVTRAKIEYIRGVSSDSAITRLLDRNLIREAGRMDSPGKPILYETTEEFLRSFGFRSIGDMPVLSMNSEEENNEA